jgi:hypothetical protein
MPILTQIKKEVRKLNTKDIIWDKITNLEKALEFEFNKKRFIYSPKCENEEDQVENEKVERKKSPKVRISNENLNTVRIIFTIK